MCSKHRKAACTLSYLGIPWILTLKGALEALLVNIVHFLTSFIFTDYIDIIASEHKKTPCVALVLFMIKAVISKLINFIVLQFIL